MKVILFLSCFVLLCSCGDKSPEQPTEVSSAIASEGTETEIVEKETPAIKADFSKQPAKTVLDFLKWYKKNYKAISAIQLTDQRITKSHPAYTVNTKGIEAYLKFLGKSGHLSTIYLDGWKNYFREREAFLYDNKQTDGPPEGFQFDFILWTQELDETLAAIDKEKLIEVQEMSPDRVKVSVDVHMKLRFTLSKTGDKWLIDDIENRGQE